MENNTLALMILFEEDKADRNVSAYLPELGLQIIGDTFDEARENAIDSVHAEIEKVKSIDKLTTLKHSFVKYIDSFSVLYEEGSAGKFSAYVPALRLTVNGKNLEEAEENVKVLISVELEELRSHSKEVPRDSAIFSTISVNVPVIS